MRGISISGRELPPSEPLDPEGLASEGRGPHVSVNVSARQFRDPGFVDSVRQALQALEHSPSFGTVKPGSSLPPTQAEPLFRYRFTVNYAQKL